MSFTSNFLKALQKKGVNTTTNAGGTMPSASSEDSTSSSGGNNYTSNFLSALKKQNSMTISERARVRAQALIEKQQARTPTGTLSNYRRNNNGLTTSGGYYSRPTLNTYSEKLYSNIAALESALTEKRASLDTAQTSLHQAENELKTVQEYLQEARAAYDAEPTEVNANSYNQIVGAYNLAYDSYTSAFDAYSTAYDAYKPYEDQLINTLAVHQVYSNQQQAAFDEWRSTIRDADTIQREITALDQQITNLEILETAAAEVARQDRQERYEAQQAEKPWYEKLLGYMGGIQDTSLPMAGITPGTVEDALYKTPASVSDEMQSLLDMKALLQDELNWSQYYYYADFANADNFAELSKYIPQERKERSALDIVMNNYSDGSSGWDDPLYEYINGNEEAGAYISNAASNYYGSDNALGSIYGRVTESNYESQQMTEREVAIYNYLYATQGRLAANKYYNYLLSDLNYLQRKADEEYWAEYAAKNPIGSSVFSVVMSPLKGLSYVGQLSDYLGDGEIDQNAAYNKFSYIPSTIRETVPENWGAVGTFAYQTGMSMADFLLTTAITGGNQAAALTIMGSGAAADTTLAAKDRGLEDWQAFTLGTVAGLAEVLTEKVSLDTLLNAELLKDGILKYVIKNALAEGSEEVASSTINQMADIIVSKDQSEWMKSIEAYMADGMTEDEAFAKAMADQALSLGVDFLGGFISGAVMGGGGAAIGSINTKKLGNELGKIQLSDEDIQTFIETGLESDPDTASYQIATELQAKIQKGQTLSTYDLSRLYQANVQAIQAEEEAAEDLPDDTNDAGNKTGTVADDVTEPSGLQLPDLENDTQTTRLVTQNGQNVTQNSQNITANQMSGTMAPDGVPLSAADRLRQEQNLNGGIQYESTYERAAGPATAQPAGELHAAGGTSLLDGGAERNVGTGTAEQAGVLASSPEQHRSTHADRSRATVARQNYARSLRLEKVSSLDLGLQNGTETRNIQVMPQEHWDAEMSQLADRIYNETGKSVTYVMGRIQIRGAGGTVGYVRGVFTGDRIIIQADHLRIPMEQIADHEAYHAKVDFTDGRLNDEIRRHIVETFSEEQFRQVLDKYIVGLRGVIDVNETHTGAKFEAAVRQIEEEIFADAYAGINAFGAGADQFTSAVNEKMDQLYMGKIRNQDNGTEEPTGPPTERHSVDDTLEQELEDLSLRSLDEADALMSYHASTTDDTTKPSTRSEYIKGDISPETVEADIEKVAHMEPVAQITGEEFTKGEKDLITQVTEFFAELDNRAYNPQLGSVTLDRQGARSDIAHGIGRKKAAAFAAVPDVLARGYVVDYQKNWKGRGYDTAVVAAPVRIGSDEYLMGIVLNRNPPENKFYVHEVLTTENGASPFKTGTRKGNPSGDTPSVFSILDKIRAVKNQAGTNEQFSADDRVSAEDSDDLSLQPGERFSADEIDIQHSVDDTGVQQDYEKLKAQWKNEQQNYQESWWREKLGDEGYEQYKKTETQRQTQVRQENIEKQKQLRQQKAAEFKKRTEEKLEATRQAEERKLKNADKPTRAKRNLKNTLLNLFSIPSGQRAELSSMIESYANRLIKNGTIFEEDRKALFDRLYDSGVMTEPANEYYAQARSYLKGGKIYIPDSVVNDFGDDWNDIRRRAFAAGIYLTRTQIIGDRNISGIDAWNSDLASDLPGLFDAEEIDQRTILERIIQVAEEGKDEKLSLREYTARLTGEGVITEDEFMDNMERQIDWALRSFSNEADLEVKLKQGHIKKTAELNRKNIQQRAEMAAERETRKELAQRARDRKELSELQQRTLKQLQWLSKNRNRAPEELKATWDEVLGDIDLYAVGAANEMQWSDKYNATWKDLAQMYKDAMKNDPNFLPSKELERIVTRLDGTKIADMDIGALQDLYKAAIGLRTEFYNRNNVINDDMQRLFAEVYTDAKREIETAPGGFTGKKVNKFLNLDQLTPMNVLQRMGGWDPDGAFYSMAKQLERGERDMRAYSVKAQKILQDFLTEHEDWVKKADGQGKDAIWYEVEVPQLLELHMGDKPIFGPTVKVYMTPAQKVHMYLESKNLDNLRHMTGGRTFVDKELYSQGKRQEALAQGRTIKLAPETVRKLVSDLTAEEMELAQILDRYYNTFATQEINKVSNILYGYDKAMGKNYTPIYTNRNYTKTEFGVFDTTAEGVGNLKGRQYAVNPSYNISALDAFERHVDQTARFCGMAIPARNWTTLMNWREKNNSTGDVITHKWGEESKKYIEDLITTLQAGDQTKTDTVSSGLSKLQSNYISAIFGTNPSIVLKQLGSIPLAGAYLDARNIPTPAQIANIDRNLISRYTQELEWRTMGYTTPETKQLKDNPNWTQTNKGLTFVFGGGAITAMDGWAASTLWPWAENKVRREHPELEVGSQEQVESGQSPFYKKVAEEFDNAVSRSQSVSDEMHQGTLRKSKNPITRAFTLFRSDSAQTYNALRQKIGEARYYMRTGAKDKVIRNAKKAAGTVFVAMLLNAAWSEAVSFLMALWKNKGKYYRDDEDEMTFESVAGEMVSGMLGSFAGVVTGGEEIFELIGNIITGDTWYGIETPGMEQLNDLLDTLIEAGSGMRDLVAGGWDILKNDGDLVEYFGKHSGQILGSIKDLAEAAATYMTGLPASNLEAYLVGALKWISPELGTAYDDLFSDIGKSDLAGMEGAALEARISRILSDRRISESEETTQVIAALYEAGHKTAIPSDTPTSVSINGEKQSLGAYQQQTYDTIWGGIVADALDDMVASNSFTEADSETQAKMLSNLYTYAAEQAKTELFDEYEMDSGAVKNAAIVAAGATVAECIAWNTITGGKNPDGTNKMSSADKSTELLNWDIPESAKRAIFLNKISDSREDSIAAFEEVGLPFNQFLQAYSMYSQINNEDLKAGMKAVEFSHWVNAQGYTAEQAAVVKDELTYFNMTPASSDRYDELVGSDMDPDDAYDLTGALNELQPGDGEDEVSDLQKWRASVDFSDDVDDQLAALSAVMTDAQFQKVEIANNFGVSPDTYVTLQEIKPQYDTDGNGSYNQEEIQAAVDGLPGYYTTEQKAVLWQLATGSTSSKNNPYSRQVGQQVLDARAAAKEAAAQEQTEASTTNTDDDSFSQELLNQLLGRE